MEKTNFVYATVYRHVLPWLFLFILTAILANRSIKVPELDLNNTRLDYLKIMYFLGVSFTK